jgi:hypothetical protein
MAKGIKTGGRKKGTPNKVNASMRAAFHEAFDNLGGVPALVRWAQSEPTEFYKLAARLIPIDVTSNGDSITIERVTFKQATK